MSKLYKYLYIAAIAVSSSLLTAIVGAILVVLYVVQPFQKQAVDLGFAMWEVTNNATGSTKFTWNEFATALHPDNSDKFFDQIEEPLPQISKR